MGLSKSMATIPDMPAWAASVITAVFSLILPFLFVGIVSVFGLLLGISDDVLGNFIAYLCTGITVAIMCFFICKAHPKTFWYVPIICNAITLWSGLGNYFSGSPFFNELLPFGIGWLLSVIAAILGQRSGKQHFVQDQTP